MLHYMEKLYIDSPDKLTNLCQQLRGSKWLALDTEFMREKTYYPRLCLLQVGTPDITACIDTQSLPDIDPLLDIIYDPSITKVFHAAGQDLEIFYHLKGSLPEPLFDTQVAAPLLGFPEQAGYARLVDDILGIHLGKAHTRADWSHRPLTEAQLKYAADDVIYLCQIYEHLRDELDKRGRLKWLQNDFTELSDPSRHENLPEKAWRRVKAANKLRGASLAVLQALAKWREKTAQDVDMPRGWLLKDDVLVDIARQQPAKRDELARIRGLHERIVKKYGEQLLGLIKDSSVHTPEALPDFIRSSKLSVAQEGLVDLLNAVVHLRASELELNPAQLASRKHLQRMILGQDNLEVMQGWRKDLVGVELQSILNSEKYIYIENGKLRVQTE
ncbi:MAG TPA: ribonuclease D [Gammaproteobacteria bacterium]|nr:ribonuclease D [Gammaproteobacteria bacterium]